MKARTALHKKIAFIFEEAPSPPAAPKEAAAESAPAPASGAYPYGPQPIPAPSGASEAGTVPAARPAPKEKRPSSARHGRKKSKKEAREMKMLILAGILSVIFAAVLFFVLSTPASSPKKKAPAAAEASPAASVSSQISWSRPEPWPEEVRDPMAPQAAGQTADGAPLECIVRGIVFSQTRPSAIIGDQIVVVGDTYNGIKIAGITKDAVEFEKEGRRWTQTVQR